MQTFILVLIIGSFLIIRELERSTGLDMNDFKRPENTIYYDRSGRVLSFFPDERGERRLWTGFDAIPDRVIQAFLAAEDARFFEHTGYDIRAIIRAIWDNSRQGHVVSGASTITQQLVKLVYPRERNFYQKFIELIKSVRLESKLSKEQILEHYLNRVYLGNNIVGICLAARRYFEKPLDNISIAEAALLASLPKAPGYYNPYGPHLQELLDRKDWVLGRMLALGYLDQADYEQARTMSLSFSHNTEQLQAPHLVFQLKNDFRNRTGSVKTTLDLDLQTSIEHILSSHRERLHYRGARQAACLIVDNRSMEVLALVGSLEYGPTDLGYNCGSRALRSAGSTLKPFLYGLALEQGYTAATLLEDTEQRFRSPRGDYIPTNYDRRAYGPMTIRKALANSLNLSAIKMLNCIGYEPFYHRLQQLGLINYPDLDADHYGLGLVVGNPEVSLEQLVSAYATLANNGCFRPLRFFLGPSPAPDHGTPIFSPAVASIITDILADPGARSLTFGNRPFDFPFRVALKTGTSTNYRDCWTIGYTPDYTIGVWVGNFDGQPTYQLSGASGAGPIFADIVRLLYRHSQPSSFSIDREVVTCQVCSSSGLKPSPYCRHVIEEFFIKGTAPTRTCTFHTADSEQHHLPNAYADWLYDRDVRGLPSNYALADRQVRESGFDNPWHMLERSSDQPIIRAKNNNESMSAATVSPPVPDQTPGKIRLGLADHDELTESGATLQGRKELKIAYPLEGDRFIKDRDHPKETILFKASAGPDLDRVTWFVDGFEYTTTTAPFQTYWPLQHGQHTIMAAGPYGYGESISITVE